LWLHSPNTVRGADGKSTYEIRVAGTVPLDLLENFRQIETVEPAGTILHAKQLDDAALWGLIDALRNAGIDLIEIRREVTTASDGALH
jgi:2-keto-3-deoxy-6-phosphogluconate aldolase